MLTTREVTIRRGGNLLLDRVSIDVPAGSLTMLIGPNGAGKSTLLRVLAGTLRADSGVCLIDDDPIGSLSFARLAQRRAVVPQSMEIAFRFSAREVVELGLGEAADAASARVVEQAMYQTDCESLACRVYTDLSGGERARVQIARALAQLRFGGETAGVSSRGASRFLLLDEPGASLDPGQQHRLLVLLEQLVDRQGLGVLVTMHDLNLASQYARRVWLLERGRMVSVGSAAQVIGRRWIEPVFGVGLRGVSGGVSGDDIAAGSGRPVATVPAAVGTGPTSAMPGVPGG